MKTFFRFFFGTILGGVVTLLLFVLIIWIIIAVSASGDKIEVKANSILKLDLEKQILDRGDENQINIPAFNFINPETIGLNQILKSIDRAAKDENIKGIYIEIRFAQAGISVIDEIRDALIKFKESGKFVYCYSEIYTQSVYYLGSVADHLYINPKGSIIFTGLSSQLAFFKGAMEKLGIEAEIFRGPDNVYKSAVEPFMYDKLSPENRVQLEALMNGIWDYVLAGISKEREIPVDSLKKYANELLVANPAKAVDYKFFDAMKYKDEVITELKELCEVTEELEVISLSDYIKAPTDEEDLDKFTTTKIAVIYAEGEIVSDDPNEELKNVSSDVFAKSIREAREDDNVKAIVLRVNSPGGSALASEVILREIELARQTKPVIASFGNVAASGGYYIACKADTIVCNPMSITGSIGVFGMLINYKELMNNKLGVTFDDVKTSTYADLGNPSRSITDYERAVINAEIEDIYNTFVNHVATGRNMTQEAVNEVGRGRVWSGIDAQTGGLIDILGGLNKAIEIAAEKAGIEEYRTVEYPEKLPPFEAMFKETAESIEIKIMQKRYGEFYLTVRQIEKLTNMNGVQARLPYTIDIH